MIDLGPRAEWTRLVCRYRNIGYKSRKSLEYHADHDNAGILEFMLTRTLADSYCR